MKKLFLVLSIFFIILTFVGAFYVITNDGKVSAGYAVIPMIFAIAFMTDYRRKTKAKNKQEEMKIDKYLQSGIAIGLPCGTAIGASYAFISNVEIGIPIAIGAISGILIGATIGLLIDRNKSR